MRETNVVQFINTLLNIGCLILLVMILRWCNMERSRADRLEDSNRKLTNRFIRFVMQLPIEHRVNIADIENDSFDEIYRPRKTEDDTG